MQNRFSPLTVLLLALALSAFTAMVQVGLVNVTFQKLNLSAQSAFLLLMSSVFGSVINLPLFSIEADATAAAAHPPRLSMLRPEPLPFNGTTLIALNVGGGLLPVCLSFYLFVNSGLTLVQTLPAIALVAAVSYRLSRPVPGLGIAMPFLIAPILASLVSVILGGDYAAQLAYISGCLGVLIGADLMHLANIRHMGAPVASIGGAGTFDGIFLTGLVAVLLT